MTCAGFRAPTPHTPTMPTALPTRSTQQALSDPGTGHRQTPVGMCRAASTPTGNPTPNSGAAAPPPAHRLGEALTALAAAAVTLRARVAPRVPAWTLIGQITHARLVAPAAPAAPG